MAAISSWGLELGNKKHTHDMGLCDLYGIYMGLWDLYGIYMGLWDLYGIYVGFFLW
jgi:hypothetical protein